MTASSRPASTGTRCHGWVLAFQRAAQWGKHSSAGRGLDQKQPGGAPRSRCSAMMASGGGGGWWGKARLCRLDVLNLRGAVTRRMSWALWRQSIRWAAALCRTADGGCGVSVTVMGTVTGTVTATVMVMVSSEETNERRGSFQVVAFPSSFLLSILSRVRVLAGCDGVGVAQSFG